MATARRFLLVLAAAAPSAAQEARTRVFVESEKLTRCAAAPSAIDFCLLVSLK